jgi:hypothetical protein
MATTSPKVFIGGRELAGTALTAADVKKLVSGPSGIFSEYGYVPINSDRTNR